MSYDLEHYSEKDFDQARENANAYIQGICQKYGLYGRIVSFSSQTVPESDRNHDYIVAGIYPEIEGDLKLPGSTEPIDPEQILRKARRSDKFFYPDIWVYDLSENSDQMAATDSLVEYVSDAKFIRQLYTEYDVPFPTVLRTAEVNRLKDALIAMNHPNATPELQKKIRMELDEFFKREKNPGKREWMQYYRSDRFPDGKGSVAKMQGFRKRDEQEVSMEQLMKFNGDISTLEMQEHEFQLFRELMAKLHPDVTYSVGKKEVVDHGLSNIPGDEDSPFGTSVSGEEYAVIRKQRFAEEGWSAVEGLKMAYWEYRDVCYRDVDEPLVASVYNKIILEYAKCDPLSDLISHGPMHLAQIPSTDFMNFVSLAKSNHLRFYIDTDGIYSVPSLKHVNVIYNEEQADKLEGIRIRMMDDKVNYSHVSEHLSLQDRLQRITPSAKPSHRSPKSSGPSRD